MNPHKVKRTHLTHLTDLPNGGKATAADLRLLGFSSPDALKGQYPFSLYKSLCARTGKHQDPCVLDVFISITDFLKGEAPRPWWAFTDLRQCRYCALLEKRKGPKRDEEG